MLAFKNLGPCTIYIPCTELSEYPHLHTYVSITELSPTVASQLAFLRRGLQYCQRHEQYQLYAPESSSVLQTAPLRFATATSHRTVPTRQTHSRAPR